MMNNKEIARRFKLLGDIMELHGENPFKIRSYRNAYNTLRKIEDPLADMSQNVLGEIKGVGKAIAEKIIELVTTEEMSAYRKYADITPPGIIEMLGIRGFGPKKIAVVWKEMGIETIGELLYACNENRLIELKGFGAKTQEQLKKQLQYFIDSKGKYLYGYIIDEAKELINKMKEHFPDYRHDLTGELRRNMPIVDQIEILTTLNEEELKRTLAAWGVITEDDRLLVGDYPVCFHYSDAASWGSELVKTSMSPSMLTAIKIDNEAEEEEVFKKIGLPYVSPEFWDYPEIFNLNKDIVQEVVTTKDIKGVVHSHSTFSDGIHTVQEMADHARSLGYEYLAMTDHSQIAVYANGLSEDRVFAQFEVIDDYNAAHPDFKIFKGIEADILSDGAMDYGNDFLQNFEIVIASIHSGLKMDKEKAMTRLIKAIENPYTHILGHPTGRLLLSREGYPIDHQKMIDACAANGMAIELNANPLRLDLDWTWIPYAMEKGVMISINPDSHNRESISYIEYGVKVARKALLSREMCLNTLDRDQFASWLNS